MHFARPIDDLPVLTPAGHMQRPAYVEPEDPPDRITRGRSRLVEHSRRFDPADDVRVDHALRSEPLDDDGRPRRDGHPRPKPHGPALVSLPRPDDLESFVEREDRGAEHEPRLDVVQGEAGPFLRRVEAEDDHDAASRIS